MKLKTDSNALLTAAAFGTATFMMVALNQNGNSGVSNIENSEAASQRFARGIDETDEVADFGACPSFIMDGEDCPETNDDQLDADDVAPFADPQEGRSRRKKGGRDRQVPSINNFWNLNEDRINKYSELMRDFTKTVEKATTRRSPKQAPVSIPDEHVLPAGSPWFDGDFDYLNEKVNPDTLDMTEYTLKAFNIFYPQTPPYDGDVGVSEAANLWEAYKEFIGELFYLISTGVNGGIGNDLNLIGYIGTQFKTPFKKNARQVLAYGSRNDIKDTLDDSAYGSLGSDGFIIPTRRGKVGTMSFAQPRYRNTIDYWKRFYNGRAQGFVDMTTSTQTCVTVYMMHDIFQDASVLDNWFLGGTNTLQSDNRENLKQCVVVPVMIHGDTEGVSEWMDSAIAAMVPNAKRYAQSHADKKQFHKLTYSDFIRNWRSVARNIASWTSTYVNRGQCLSTADPNDFIEDDQITTTAGPATTTTAGTTTTDWTTANEETTVSNPFRDVTTAGDEGTSAGDDYSTTTSIPEDKYCCFATINSSKDTISNCMDPELHPFDEVASFF